MRNSLHLVVYLAGLVSVFLIQGEAAGQLSIGLSPETTTLTTITAPTVQPADNFFVLTIIVFLIIVAYAVKMRL